MRTEHLYKYIVWNRLGEIAWKFINQNLPYMISQNVRITVDERHIVRLSCYKIWYNVTFHHTLQCQTSPYLTMSHFTIPYNVSLHHTLQCLTSPYLTMSDFTIPYNVRLHHTLQCQTNTAIQVLCFVTCILALLLLYIIIWHQLSGCILFVDRFICYFTFTHI